MSVSDLLKSIGEREMNRKEFVKFFLLAIGLVVGPKNLLALMATVNAGSSVADEHTGLDDGSYNGGNYNG